MIKILKKHKYKLLTLMLSIISIFTLFFGINNTYAYETNQFSYTIDTTNETFTTINDKNGIILTYNNTKYFTLKDNNQVATNDYILVNFLCLDSNNNVINFTESISYNAIVGQRMNQFSFIINNTEYVNNGIYTNINKLNVYSSTSNQIGLQITLNYNVKIFITNIDIVKPYDIGLSQYYETYYGQIEDNYNVLLNDYNALQDNYDTLDREYDTLQANYNNLNSQVESLQSQITTLQNQKNTLEQQLDQVKEEYEYIINQTAPFNPSNIQSTSVIFNNTTIDIPYNSFVIFDYFQIELDLMDFDLIYINNRDLIQSINNKLTITLNLEKPIVIDNLEYWCSMRDFYGDCLNLTLLNNENIINEYLYMNNEHQDSQGDMAPYYISSGGKNINRLVFEFVLNDTFYNNYQGKIDYMVQSGTYTQGYNDGLNASNQYIDKLKNEIIEDEQYILSLERTINALQEQVNSFSSDYNLNNLMWTIASTPFESFKQIWNVEFFGVNISTMITGFITGLIVLWIIKKFFL